MYTRRSFVGSTAALAGAAVLLPEDLRAQEPVPEFPALPGYPVKESVACSPDAPLNIACIGVGGRGRAHVGPALKENLVAVCDVSQNTLGSCLKFVEKAYNDKGIKKPLPTTFDDYRKLFDTFADKLDAVVVAVPDNHHASVSLRAIAHGKHVYCEKPLTHDLHEARQLTLAAREAGVATQMGNGGRAGEGWRRLCEYLWTGVLGEVQEVHTWTDRAGTPNHFWWPQGGTRPPGEDPIPAELNWEAWLGPAPYRPFVEKYKEGKFKGKRVYHPFVWRGWWDFGTGALGDIGCHVWSGIHTALQVEHAAAVTLLEDTGDNSEEMFPTSAIIEWEIPANEKRGPCKLYWYDGGKFPPRELGQLAEGKEYPSGGTILVTDKGTFWASGEPRVISAAEGAEFPAPPKTLPRCASNHFDEWVTACKGGRPAFSNFDHAGPLTEMVLLGNLALRAGVGNRVEWNGPDFTVTNRPELNQHLRREYREGWELAEA